MTLLSASRTTPLAMHPRHHGQLHWHGISSPNGCLMDSDIGLTEPKFCELGADRARTQKRKLVEVALEGAKQACNPNCSHVCQPLCKKQTTSFSDSEPSLGTQSSHDRGSESLKL
ncbi:hypothetical protein ACFX13_026393 [Malus domestica]